MKTFRLKRLCLPALYILTISVIFVSITLLTKALSTYKEPDEIMVSSDNNTENTTPVIKEEQTPEEDNPKLILRPFTSDQVRIKKSYYDMADNEEKQENSIIYYEKTYLQNSGILYEGDTEFEVKAVYDGKVTNVAKDDILGNYIEITHNSNLKTLYYCLNDIAVKQDDEITAGTIIGKSGTNMLEPSSNNTLLFEVYYNGFTINPEYIFDASINDYE